MGITETRDRHSGQPPIEGLEWFIGKVFVLNNLVGWVRLVGLVRQVGRTRIMMDNTQSIIGAHGGYRKLGSFQTARIVYDATVIFCDRFVDRRSRTRDQMIQAARSGVQNIAEGSVASATSNRLCSSRASMRAVL